MKLINLNLKQNMNWNENLLHTPDELKSVGKYQTKDNQNEDGNSK